MTRRSSGLLGLVLGLGLALWLGLAPAVGLAQGLVQYGDPTGNYYIVQDGDTWANIAYRNGLPVNKLIAANPELRRPGWVLWPGDRMFIPIQGEAAPAEPAAPAPEKTRAAEGYWYTVQRGDTWQTVSRDTGVPVLELWHANPGLLYPNRWLYWGTRLWIPAPAAEQPAAPPEATATPEAPPAEAPPPAVPTLPEVPPSTPSPVEPVAPSTVVTPTETMEPATPTPIAPSVEITATTTVTPTMEVTPVVEPSPVVTATATVTPTTAVEPAVTPSATVTTTTQSGCPAQLADYDRAIATYLNSPGASADSLRTWLTRCGAITDEVGSLTEVGIRSTASKDIVVALTNPAGHEADTPGRLLVFQSLPNGYVLTGAAQGEGKVTVLAVGDANQDEKSDIIWTDTICGASVCNSTLFVDTWTGNGFQSWLEDQPITANAEYGFRELTGASGLAIVITGTVGGSVSGIALPALALPAVPATTTEAPSAAITATTSMTATAAVTATTAVTATVAVTPTTSAPAPAPRTYTVVYVSVDGGLYHRLSDAEAAAALAAAPPAVAPEPTAAAPEPTVAAPVVPATPVAPAPVVPAPGQPSSPLPTPQAAPPTEAGAQGPCLTDRIQDANLLFGAWATAGFGPAVQAYQNILTDQLSACTLSPDQTAALRDFVRFRLIVALMGNGQASTVQPYRDQMETPAVRGAADALLKSYQDTHSVVQACRDTTTYAQAHPEAWAFVQKVAPEFSAADLCPLG
jgi:LysM repeat protein